MVTRIDPDQIKTPPFDDTKSSGSTLESGAVDLADAIDSVMSQVKNLLGETNWYDTPDETVALLAARAKLEDKLALKNAQLFADVSVPASQNYVALGAGEYPSEVKAIATSVKGAVTAQLAGAIGSHSLTEIAGSNALNPKNLLHVIDGTTGDPILSGGKTVYGLLQVGSAATDGTAFAASGDEQAQISFVRANATYDDLEACPVADIESTTINYGYVVRNDLDSLSEQAFLPDFVFADAPAAAAVSMDAAYNGGSIVTVDDTDVDFRLTDTKEFVVSDSTGAVKILRVQALAAGDELEINGALDMNGDIDGNSNKATFNEVEVGGAAGRVARTGGDLTLQTITSGNVHLSSVAEIQFTTSRETALELDDVTSGAISGLFSQSFSSVAAAIKYAGEHGGVDLTLGIFVAGSNYSQDVNIPGGAGGLDISSPHSIDMNTPAGVDTFLFLNGRLLYGGNGTTQNDVYAGDTPASGDIKVDFPKGIKTGDVIIAIQFVQ